MAVWLAVLIKLGTQKREMGNGEMRNELEMIVKITATKSRSVLSDWKILYSYLTICYSLEKLWWLCQASMVPPLNSARANLTPELDSNIN